MGNSNTLPTPTVDISTLSEKYLFRLNTQTSPKWDYQNPNQPLTITLLHFDTIKSTTTGTPLSDEELDTVCYPHDNITLVGENVYLDSKAISFNREYTSKTKGYFTIRDLANIILNFELSNRQFKNLSGHLDVNTNILKSLKLITPGTFAVMWESS